MKLYNYFRSGTSYRTRIVLNLKGLGYDYVPISLLKGEQHGEAFRALNPQGLVPALDDDGFLLGQSPAIIEYLEEAYPEPPLLPKRARDRAHVRALAAIVGCDIHPINNLRVLKYLRETLGQNEESVKTWCGTWIAKGFDAYEALLRADRKRGGFSFGNAPTIADAYLIPQVFGAERFGVDLAPWPEIGAVNARCRALPAFADAHPSKQPDAE